MSFTTNEHKFLHYNILARKLPPPPPNVNFYLVNFISNKTKIRYLKNIIEIVF